MRLSRPVRDLLLRLCAAGTLLLAGCEDAPTGPRVLQQEAGGERWIAMTPPLDLPRLESWVPHLSPRTPESRAALQRVRELSREAEQARADGRLARADALQREATRIAVLSLRSPPPPRVVASSLAAIDLWLDRVRTQIPLERYGAMEASYQAVAEARALAAGRLADGDTLGAVHHLAAAAEHVRDQAPEAVALRVLAEAERRLPPGEPPPELVRAVHLIGNARQELIRGSPARALQRALYALQILEGRQIGVRPDGVGTGGCAGASC
jgi:hypothetical protein